MKKTYTQQEIINGLLQLTKELAHEPTAHEIDVCTYLPTSRQIQRRYGGLPAIRQAAGLTITDHTRGKTRTIMANFVNDRANKYHLEYVNKMITKHHDYENLSTLVVREYAYQQWIPSEGYYKNIASDVAIVDSKTKHVTLFDFFYPKDKYSFSGCVRMKRSKLRKHPVSLSPGYTHKVVFVCMNTLFTQEEIATHPAVKDDIEVISLDSFKEKYL